MANSNKPKVILYASNVNKKNKDVQHTRSRRGFTGIILFELGLGKQKKGLCKFCLPVQKLSEL